jgi:N-acetyl-anhydromuramyl-L-alanine amidase AmpD
MFFTTPPLTIIDHPADAQHCGGQTRLGYRYIVIHATGGTNSLDWLSTTSPPSNPVSIHRLIAKDGTIYKIVADTVTAYHAGPAEIGPLPGVGQNVNNWSLGIELENRNDGRDPYPSAQLDAAAAQVVEWIGVYGFLSIVGHGWIDVRKHDPAGLNWPDFYARIWAKLKAVAKAS